MPGGDGMDRSARPVRPPVGTLVGLGAVASVILAACLPVVCLIWLAGRLSDPGPDGPDVLPWRSAAVLLAAAACIAMFLATGLLRRRRRSAVAVWCVATVLAVLLGGLAAIRGGPIGWVGTVLVVAAPVAGSVLILRPEVRKLLR